MRDLYEVLEVDRQASASDLKKAYYRLAKKYHPDHNPGDKVAEEKFKEASNAYSILSDDDPRRGQRAGRLLQRGGHPVGVRRHFRQFLRRSRLGPPPAARLGPACRSQSH